MFVCVFCFGFAVVVIKLYEMYILEIKSVMAAHFASIFSQSIGCLFVLFMVSFSVRKFISLIRSHLCFAFVSITLGDRPMKTLL